MGDNMSDEKFGYIVMDVNETLIGTQSGKNHEVLHRFSFDLPTKFIKGVHTAYRFARLRAVKFNEHLRKTAELANQYYINPSSNMPNVAGVILAYSEDFAKFNPHFYMLNPLLEVLDVLEVSNGVENGFNQAIELASEVLTNAKFIREKRLIEKYLEKICLDTGKNAYGLDATMKVLESKSAAAFKTLFVWENIDINRYVMKNSTTGETVIKYLKKEQEDKAENFKELDVKEKMPLLEWLANESMRLGCALELVTNKTQIGSWFCTAFGGIGGILHYRIDFQEDEAVDENDGF